MKNGKLKALAATTATGFFLLGFVACSDSASPTAASPALTTTTTTTTTGIASQATTADILAAMERTIQDEYHAENIYLRVIADFGEVRPFVNVVNAEERHSEAIAGLYRNRALEVPASRWNLDNVPRFGSVTEACAAAVQAEKDNIALYDSFFAMDLPNDVRNVFTNNRFASLDKHLPAFESCAGN